MQNWGSCEHWLVWPSLEPLMQNWQAAAVKNESWIAWQTCSKQCRSHETCCAIFVQHMFPKYSNNANSDFPKFVQCWFLISYGPPPLSPHKLVPEWAQTNTRLTTNWPDSKLTPDWQQTLFSQDRSQIDTRSTPNWHHTDSKFIPIGTKDIHGCPLIFFWNAIP